MKAFQHGLLAIVLACCLGVAAASETGILTAKEAYGKARSGEVMLVDVRSPREWQQTGVPAGSVAETIHGQGGLPAFAEALLARLGGDKSKPVALICARGARSAYTRQYLEQAGFTDVSDVSEGMVGGKYGPGWQSQGLPVERWSGK